jgi:hypothetical protein
MLTLSNCLTSVQRHYPNTTTTQISKKKIIICFKDLVDVSSFIREQKKKKKKWQECAHIMDEIQIHRQVTVLQKMYRGLHEGMESQTGAGTDQFLDLCVKNKVDDCKNSSICDQMGQKPKMTCSLSYGVSDKLQGRWGGVVNLRRCGSVHTRRHKSYASDLSKSLRLMMWWLPAPKIPIHGLTFGSSAAVQSLHRNRTAYWPLLHCKSCSILATVTLQIMQHIGHCYTENRTVYWPLLHSKSCSILAAVTLQIMQHIGHCYTENRTVYWPLFLQPLRILVTVTLQSMICVNQTGIQAW